jgi:tetratricopeptide (TPR) repeat protein
MNYFPGLEDFRREIVRADKSVARQLEDIYRGIIDVIELSSYLVIACTIQSYKEQIRTETGNFRKPARQIKKILREKFFGPSLGKILELTQLCCRLIDETAPVELQKMKQCLRQSFKLGTIGNLLDDFDTIYDSIKVSTAKHGRPRRVNRADTVGEILTGILFQFKEYRNDDAHLSPIRRIIEDNWSRLNLKFEIWYNALEMLIRLLEPILSIVYVGKSLGRMQQSETGEHLLTVQNWKYHKGIIDENESTVRFDDWSENKWDFLSQALMTLNGESIHVDLSPFLLVKDRQLWHYKGTTARGYEYFSIGTGQVFLYPTKRKFDHAVFGVATRIEEQIIFWLEVPPNVDSVTRIRSNIPVATSARLVGRVKELRQIRENILEIPNRDGIIYGVGGIGKTELLIHLSNELRAVLEGNNDRFDNIFWISAKRELYDPFRNVTERKSQKLQSLEDVLTALLYFFEYEDAEEYDFNEKRELVFEVAAENPALIILDNYETLPRKEATSIINFFGTELKRKLRQDASNFKTIISSREYIPSGFWPLKLPGLDIDASKELMRNMAERYAGSRTSLSEEQMEAIYRATQGVPILLKHCVGQYFEANESFKQIIQQLPRMGNEAIRFSFREIIKSLKKDQIKVRVLILLESVNTPLSSRQISEILEVSEDLIHEAVKPLLTFQCIDRENEGLDEKYTINQYVHVLTKALAQEEVSFSSEIRRKITANFTLDKRTHYTSEELEIVDLFKNYIARGELQAAERFLKESIRKQPASLFLKMHFARYLKDVCGDVRQAIDILEQAYQQARSSGIDDPTLLLLLGSCYVSLDIPSFERANTYFSELKQLAFSEDIVKVALAEFYISWSTALKVKPESDPIKELQRRSSYKRLATEAVEILEDLRQRDDSHRINYLLAQANYNRWDNERALKFIDRAMELASGDIILTQFYSKLRQAILVRLDKKKR